MGVAVAIGIAGPVKDHGVMEQGLTVHVLGLIHFFQEFPEAAGRTTSQSA